jgi:hypothetical protein
MSKIVDLSLNIPNELKGALKKNAINDILTTEIQTSIMNNEDTQEIKNSLYHILQTIKYIIKIK